MWRFFRRDDLHIALWTVLLLGTFVFDGRR
jgi:hypothetical protein